MDPGSSAPPVFQNGSRGRPTITDVGSRNDNDQFNHPPSHSAYNAAVPEDVKGRIDPTLQGHQRIRSWSGHHPFPMAPPNYGAYSPLGAPYIPMALGPAGVPLAVLPPQAQYSGSRRKRKAGNGHRRAQSYDATSYVPHPMDMAPPPPPLPSGRPKGNFSPRSEIIKLAGGFRPSTPSPTNSVGQSPRSRGLGYPPVPSFVPPLPRRHSEAAARHYGTNGEASIHALAGATALTGSSRGGGGAPAAGGGGEAVFAAQKKKNDKHRRSTSRKMHMRQKSAQLFMEDVKGVEQIPSCRDIVFLMLFVFHLLGVVYLGNTYGYEAVRYHDDVDTDFSVTIDYQNLLFICLLSGVFAILISAMTFILMMAVAKKIVQIALILTITLSFAWGTVGIGLSPRKVVPATGIIALALSVAYTIVVWDRVKFHGVNLYASLTGIRANPGAVLVAFFFQFLALAWSIYFAFVTAGVYDAVQIGDIQLPSHSAKICLYSALGVSYYWTLQVFLNIVQVTVASIIGNWWFTPDGDTQFRSQHLQKSFFRSIFYSIGSICYGSLLVGPVRFLRQLSALFSPNNDRPSLLCIHECIHCIQTCLTSCVDNLAIRFNPWAFTYVGLYGYNLTDAGLHSTELFEKRGWTKIVSDDLVPNVLLMTCLVIGGVTGCFAHLIENSQSLALSTLDEPNTTSFVAGTIVGVVVSSVLFGMISSSVNAVIVCFATSPVDFHSNHPDLSAEMRAAWREVWPGCMDVVDIRMVVASYLDQEAQCEQKPLLG